MLNAGPIAFIRTILIILLVYYGLKFIIRFLLPKVMNKKQNNNNPNRPGNKNNKSKSDTDLGEYVDFEEINDKDDQDRT